MATIISKTNDKLNELFNRALVEVEVVPSGNLVATSMDGVVHNAGYVGNPKQVLQGVSARLASSRRGPAKVVMLGSSTTEGVGASTESSRYVNQLARSIKESYPSGVEGWQSPVTLLAAAAAAVPTLPGVHVINGGIAGSTSASYLGSTRLGYIDTVNPSLVFHMVGSNDYALSVDPTTFGFNLIAAMDSIDSVVSDVIHIVVDTFARPDISTPVAPWIDYVDQMRRAVTARNNAAFIGVNEEFVAAGVDGYNPVDAFRLTDWRLGAGGGIHPSDSGHALLASLIASALYLPTPPVKTRAEVFDRFQRDVLGSTETTQLWEQQSGVHIPANGGLTVTTGGNAVVTTGFSDCEVSALITHNALVVPGVIAKSNDASTRIGAFLNGPSNRVEIYVGTAIQTWTTTVSLTSGREYFLKMTVSGDQVVVELDGAKVLTFTLPSATVTTYSNYKKHGVRCSTANAGVKWRNFAVRPLTG